MRALQLLHALLMCVLLPPQQPVTTMLMINRKVGCEGTKFVMFTGQLSHYQHLLDSLKMLTL